MMEINGDNVLVKGKAVKVNSWQLGNVKIISLGNILKIARVKEEEYFDIEDPASFIEALKKSDNKPDIFTFMQRLPDTEPKYKYFMERESIAAIPIKNYDHWWKNQINSKTRNLIRKAEKMGVTVRETKFDEEFIKGMVKIFNESPIRQGKPFWHYGKDFETVKEQFSEYLHREDIYGAYYRDELVGFIFLAYAGKFATLGQILSKMEHRDKAPNNALIAKAVEVCEIKKIPYLAYALWIEGSLGEFKRHSGFEKYDLPRYYCPLTIKGKLALKYNMHHGVVGVIPKGIKVKLKELRKKWYERKILIRKGEENK